MAEYWIKGPFIPMGMTLEWEGFVATRNGINRKHIQQIYGHKELPVKFTRSLTLQLETIKQKKSQKKAV